jgi:hypothetical protein
MLGSRGHHCLCWRHRHRAADREGRGGQQQRDHNVLSR